ncbi:MAG: START-like domain-containing protein [Bacteroidia bacterium]
MPHKKKKIRLEFDIKTSPALLYNYISSPSGLSQWFCKDVIVKNHSYIFIWDDNGDQSEADLVKEMPNKYIKFRWHNAKPDEFFEFEIIHDEITDDTALVIIDFIEPEEEDNIARLWCNQVHELKVLLGG